MAENVAVLQVQENPEEFFPLAAALAALENHGGENAARGEKPHQGFLGEKRASGHRVV